jgi:hypothetical protein
MLSTTCHLLVLHHHIDPIELDDNPLHHIGKNVNIKLDHSTQTRNTSLVNPALNKIHTPYLVSSTRVYTKAFSG